MSNYHGYRVIVGIFTKLIINPYRLEVTTQMIALPRHEMKTNLCDYNIL